MPQVDAILVAEVDHFLRLERCGIVCDDFPGNSESGQYVFLQELYSHLIGGPLGWHNLDPLGEVVGCSQDPFVLS